ncbi:DinB family protein [Paenibacillus sp. FSL H7-0326]|uniref:DinB family protein n=1 Tax=Paenibacillus sp. FSL H7-0326 TaxID=1921144 RepID=UPI00117DDEBE|nr:DinB family protein [Paenibacillus sp. FSL H7-0326]
MRSPACEAAGHTLVRVKLRSKEFVYVEWLSAQTDVKQKIRLNNPFTKVPQTRISEVLIQLVNHGAYHRGLYRLGYRQ